MAKILFRILHLNKTNIFSYSKLVFEQYFRKKVFNSIFKVYQSFLFFVKNLW